MAGPERRQTKFPGNASSSVLGKRAPQSDPDSDKFSSRIPQFSSHFQFVPRSRPPALPLKVNTEPNLSSSLSKKTHKVCCDGNPWTEYHPLFSILKNNEVGKIIVAYRNEYHHSIVVIKKTTVTQTDEPPKRLTACSHENIVSFHNYYLHQGSVSIPYEWMDVTLAEIRSTPCGRMESFHIAAICKEVFPALGRHFKV